MANDNVKAIKLKVTEVLRASDANSLDTALALAGLLGLLAAKMDQHEGPMFFEDRWSVITEEARTQYENIRIDVRRPILVSPDMMPLY